MKIKVKEIQANPYRDVKHYPFDKAKIESLKRSIEEKTFWDNILVRQKDNKYELAYGHHRLEALKQLGVEKIDVPVRTEKELSNALMVQIMAEENHEWSQTPAMINQTVDAVKKYLDGELGKYETWEQIRSDKSIRTTLSIENGQSFAKLKGMGVGRETILKFLGGNWKGWMIQEALDSLGYTPTAKESPVDRKAIEIIPTTSQVKEFKKEVRKHKLPVSVQRKIAKKIANGKVGKRAVEEAVEESVPALMLKKPKKEKPKPMLDEFVVDVCREMGTLRLKLIEINKNYDCVQGSANRRGLQLSSKELQEVLTKIIQRGQK